MLCDRILYKNHQLADHCMTINVFGLKPGNRFQRKDIFYQYSKSEQFTGEYWVDGKKIYALYIESTVGNLQNAINNNHSISTLIEVHGFAYAQWGQYWPIPNYHQEAGYVITTYWPAAMNGVLIAFGSFFPTGNRAIAWIKYTKTTG